MVAGKGTLNDTQVPWGKLTVAHWWLTFVAIPKPLANPGFLGKGTKGSGVLRVVG